MKSSHRKSPFTEEIIADPVDSEEDDPQESVTPTLTMPNEITKELIKLIPHYDGTGGIQTYFEFVENSEDFVSSSELTSQSELILATAKLTGDAKTWWRRHRMKNSLQDANCIRSWQGLKEALCQTFIPAETNEEV